jgi:hypothetical protein
MNELVYCPRCNREVHIGRTPAPGHLGHANIDEGAAPVCLDLGEACDGQICAAMGGSRLVLAVRLARSGLRETPWPVVETLCPECGTSRECEVLDQEHGLCTVCSTVLTLPVADQPIAPPVH